MYTTGPFLNDFLELPSGLEKWVQNGKFPGKSTFFQNFGDSSWMSLEVSKTVSLHSWHLKWVSGVSLSVQQIRFTSKISYVGGQKSTHGQWMSGSKITKWPWVGLKLQSSLINWSQPFAFNLGFSPSHLDWESSMRGISNWDLRVNSALRRPNCDC